MTVCTSISNARQHVFVNFSVENGCTSYFSCFVHIRDKGISYIKLKVYTHFENSGCSNTCFGMVKSALSNMFSVLRV